MSGGDDAANDEADTDDDDENGDHMAKIIAASDRVMDRWEQTQTEDVRKAAITRYIESGEGDAASAGMEEIEGHVLVTAYSHHIEKDVCQPFGLTLDTFQSHIADEHEHLFREAVVKGNWQWLRSWAQKIAEQRAGKSATA